MSQFANHSPLVLISGVNGYIAAQTAKAFLDAGFRVRGTSRSIKSSEPLLNGPLKSYADDGRFEVVVVEDITADGAFDKAVQGSQVIAHMASPVSQFFTDPEPVIHTAVTGTTSILKSALDQSSDTLKSFVVISSIASVLGAKKPPYTYTEADWNDVSEAEVARLGKNTPGNHIYRASKTAAEREVWKFRDQYNPSFTITAVNPVWVSGPPLVLPEDPANINETVRNVWTIFSGQEIPPPLGPAGTFVDVRDVARLMVWAATHGEEANGQRYIALGGVGGEQAIADILRKHYPERRGLIKEGTPGKGYLPGYGFPEGGIDIDSSKAVKATGQDWIGYEKAVLDAAKEFEKYLPKHDGSL